MAHLSANSTIFSIFDEIHRHGCLYCGTDYHGEKQRFLKEKYLENKCNFILLILLAATFLVVKFIAESFG